MAFQWNNALGHAIPAEVYYMFVWDTNEIRSMMAVYVVREPAINTVDVPGDSRTTTVVSDTARITTAALVYWIVRLHDHGFSLNGTLPLHGFCVTHTGLLKGTRALVDSLVPLDDVRGSSDMSALAQLARHNIYQIHQFGGAVPEEVEDLLTVLTTYTSANRLRLWSHPAHEDAMGQSSIFIKLYGLLMAMKKRNPTLFNTVKGNVDTAINSPDWICDAIKNFYLHRLVRFTSNTSKAAVSALAGKITSFLSTGLKCGNGDGEGCLKVRRNGESHLSQDYCGDAAPTETELAVCAAIAAVTEKNPALAMALAGPYQLNLQALGSILAPPFSRKAAQSIANAIVKALSLYNYSTVEADAAATAAARYLARQPVIYSEKAQLVAYRRQQVNAAAQAAQGLQQVQVVPQPAQAAQAAGQGLQQVQVAPQPLIARNLFGEKDIKNMLDLMQPQLLCVLHCEMFKAGELQELEFHWNYKEICLPR